MSHRQVLRTPIKAPSLGDTKDPRELTGNRHQQDAYHERHLPDYDGAKALAGRLLRRDGHQPAPTSQRNVSAKKWADSPAL